MSAFLLCVTTLAGGSLINRISDWSMHLFDIPHMPILSVFVSCLAFDTQILCFSQCSKQQVTSQEDDDEN